MQIGVVLDTSARMIKSRDSGDVANGRNSMVPHPLLPVFIAHVRRALAMNCDTNGNANINLTISTLFYSTDYQKSVNGLALIHAC